MFAGCGMHQHAVRAGLQLQNIPLCCCVENWLHDELALLVVLDMHSCHCRSLKLQLPAAYVLGTIAATALHPVSCALLTHNQQILYAGTHHVCSLVHRVALKSVDEPFCPCQKAHRPRSPCCCVHCTILQCCKHSQHLVLQCTMSPSQC